MTDAENFVVAVARVCREATDDGSTKIDVDTLLNLFEEHFDMKEILS